VLPRAPSWDGPLSAGSQTSGHRCEEYEGEDWWKRAVWIEGRDGALDRIDFVEWALHPAFPWCEISGHRVEKEPRVEIPPSSDRCDCGLSLLLQLTREPIVFRSSS